MFQILSWSRPGGEHEENEDFSLGIGDALRSLLTETTSMHTEEACPNSFNPTESDEPEVMEHFLPFLSSLFITLIARSSTILFILHTIILIPTYPTSVLSIQRNR